MSLIAWSIYDDTGAPLTGAVPTFVDYCDRAGVARTAPTIIELGGGQYGFTPSSNDEVDGCVFLVDNGVSNSPRRVSGPITTPEQPFSAWHLEDDTGALWTGVAPTVTSYVSASGPRTAPGIQSAKTYLFSLTPSQADVNAGVSFMAMVAGSWPQYVQESFGYAAAQALSTVGESIRAALIADAQVSALVSSRVYPSELPQASQLPAVVYSIISSVPESSFTGSVTTTMRASRVQVDCYARASGTGAYSQVHALADAVRAALGDVARPDLSVSFENERDLYDNATQYHRVSMDFTAWQ